MAAANDAHLLVELPVLLELFREFHEERVVVERDGYLVAHRLDKLHIVHAVGLAGELLAERQEAVELVPVPQRHDGIDALVPEFPDNGMHVILCPVVLQAKRPLQCQQRAVRADPVLAGQTPEALLCHRRQRARRALVLVEIDGPLVGEEGAHDDMQDGTYLLLEVLRRGDLVAQVRKGLDVVDEPSGLVPHT
jgi:hypothetical protein